MTPEDDSLEDDPVQERRERRLLLPDRYLIPLVFCLATLLVWNLLFPGHRAEDDAAQDPQDAGIRPLDESAAASPGRKPVGVPNEDSLAIAATLPAIKRNFPDDVVPSNGEVLQLGAFNQLAGAESVQDRLMRLGLKASISKRSSDNQTRYLVLLGPLAEGSESRRVKELLEQEHIVYYRQASE